MEQKKIEVSYLLSKKEYVEKNLLLQQQARKKWITALCIAAGVFFILQAFFKIMQQADIVYSILSVLLGFFIAIFYDFFILRVFAKKSAENDYEVHKEKRPSYRLVMEESQITLQSDKYDLCTETAKLWQCVVTKLQFLCFTGYGQAFCIPKRVLTQQQIHTLHALFMQQLPQGGYTNGW